jgi:hypothetical protein
MVFPLPVTIWAAVLIGVVACTFAVGAALGGRSFARDHRRVVLGYCGFVVALWLIALVEAIANVKAVTILALAILILCGIASTMGCLVLAVYLVSEAHLRRRIRLDDPKLCQKCRYNLTGNVSGTCPECGTPLPREQRRYLDRSLTWDQFIRQRR